MEQDKINAYMTLYTTLVTLCKTAAPMIPFMTESIYRNLVCSIDKTAPISIHLCDFPEVKEEWIDKELEDNMEDVLNAVVIGRACRNSTNIKNRQPIGKLYIIIDLCRTEGNPVILSTPLTSMLVHKKRAEHSAILVGTRTAKLDNPSLNVRNWYGRSPIRLVIDRKQSLSPTLHLFDGSVLTLVFTEHFHDALPNVEYLPIDFQQDILPQIMQILYERGIQSLLVEGGSTLLQSFIDVVVFMKYMLKKSPEITDIRC